MSQYGNGPGGQWNAPPPARKPPYVLIAVVAVVVIAVIVGIVVVVLRANDDDSSKADATTTSAARSSSAQTADEPIDCSYKVGSERAAKPVDPPPAEYAGDPEKQATISTNQGDIGLTLDAEKAPCTVNSFISLAEQGYFDDTACHRLTTAASLKVLQCGDPLGTGTGGPGYTFQDEYPVNESSSTRLYKRGVLAMANAGPGTNGSQFFLVYDDSQLSPDYTIFGTIDSEGLTVLDDIAAAGVEAGGQGGGDGPPAEKVEITSVKVE